MSRPLRRFIADECGAVTVDWVVLTAVAAAFGVIISTTLGSGANDVATNVETTFVNMEVAPLQTLGYSQ
ncbi:MAG: hypothetical protein KDK12_11520 [Rhodobacteraceae bacterium]|nr:hypothetical protein [Paracoccaceae bacterium]